LLLFIYYVKGLQPYHGSQGGKPQGWPKMAMAVGEEGKWLMRKCENAKIVEVATLLCSHKREDYGLSDQGLKQTMFARATIDIFGFLSP